MIAPHAKAGRNRILVIDDDPQIRKSLAKVLQMEGYAVVSAASYREAVEQFVSGDIDLVLLDLNLPVNSGWDVFGTLTAEDPMVPIIIITGRHNQIDFASAVGISALMEKPLNVSLLLETIADLLAEEPETRLRRLVGMQKDLRYVPPADIGAGAADSPGKKKPYRRP